MIDNWLTDKEAVKPLTPTIMDWVNAYRYILIKGNVDYTPQKAQAIYDNIQKMADEYEDLKYCYSPNKVFSRTCACGKEKL